MRREKHSKYLYLLGFELMERLRFCNGSQDCALLLLDDIFFSFVSTFLLSKIIQQLFSMKASEDLDMKFDLSHKNDFL